MKAKEENKFKPDLMEAQRLLAKGFKLCKLMPNSKRPEGNAWNRHPVTRIDTDATGYGVMLPANKLCSIDPDNAPLAEKLFKGLGFDLEALMNAGVRTISTRPGSGGRSAFKDPGGLEWVKFAFKEVGTVLELRATSPNLQDSLPSVVYVTKDGKSCTQRYATDKRMDDATELPAKDREWWHRMSTDLDFLRDQQRRAGEILGMTAQQAISGRSGNELAFKSRYRMEYNAAHCVEDLLIEHGYTTDDDGERYAPPNATGAPGVRRIPGKDDLWQSDHASDPLHGTFDAWSAYVVLVHGGDIAAAERAYEIERLNAAVIDFRDLEIGDDVCELALGTKEPRYKPLIAVDVLRTPDTRWLIKHVLPENSLATVYGQSGTGKSFHVLDMACAIAEGRDHYGYKVTSRPVFYLMLEGESGAKTRIQAREKYYGRPIPADLYFILQAYQLTSADDTSDLAAAVVAKVGPGAVVIIDTLNRAAPSADENSSKDFGLIIQGSKTLQRLLSGTVILVHHSGKNADMGPRGHSSFPAAVDAAIEVRRSGDAREWKLSKGKDSKDGTVHSFRLEVVHLGTDEDGDAVTSCVTVSTAPAALPSKPLTPMQQMGLEAFHRVLMGKPEGVHVDTWRTEFYRTSTADTPDAKRKQFQRLRNDLVSLGHVTAENDTYQTAGGDFIDLF